jgi:threonine dehydrogenase-like Zn-dependent dehydrogenase
MKAVVIDGQVEVREVPIPVPADGEALVRVRMAGICGTDLALLRGYKDFRGIPGHEFVGVVEEASSSPWVGKRVVAEINVACGECPLCRQGHRKHCQDRQVLGLIDRPGAFAEYVTVPIENLHEVPESLADEEAVMTEPLAAALDVWETGIKPEDPVLVLGAGRLGTLIALVLDHRGARVEVMDTSLEKLRTVEAMGVTVRTGPPKPMFPWVIEATGSATGVETALDWTRPTGNIVLKSTTHETVSVDTSRIVVDEIRVVGSRCGAFPPALEALASGRLPVRRLISSVFPLSGICDALDQSAQPGTFKVLLDFRDPRP